MDKAKLKFFIDLLMFLDFLAIAFSGFVLLFLKNGIWLYMNFIFNRGQWTRIHDWSGVTFVILLLIHLVLNSTWIKVMFKRFFSRQV